MLRGGRPSPSIIAGMGGRRGSVACCRTGSRCSSMGGAIAARFVAEQRRPVDALVLSSPALALHLNYFQRLQLAIGRRLLPNVAVPNGLDSTKISHDPEVVRAYQTDPLVHDRVTPRLVDFLLESGRVVRAEAAWWRVPTLLLFSGDDHLVDAKGSRAFAALTQRHVVTSREFPALYHEIFNERGDDVLGELTDWLQTVVQ
jgi:alpha-beta hydrolase superfamily lysophospholipase